MDAMQFDGLHLQGLLAALGEPSRFRIVLELASRERHVSDLAEVVGLSQSCTTRHLQTLERAGVVRTRRAGKRVMASLAPDREAAAALLDWLESQRGFGVEVEPGRTGGRDARQVVPQDAPPRQDSGTSPPREMRPRAHREDAGEGRDPGARARPQSGREPSALRQDRAHAAPGPSGKPRTALLESHGVRPVRPGDLEDFLL